LDTGKVVAKSSLAVSKPSKKDEAPSWFEMEFWDSLAEIAGHHLKKGDRVYVTGRVVVDTFMKNEVNQRTAKVMVQNVHFVEDTRSATTPGFSQGAVQGSGRNTSSSWAQPTQSTQSQGTQSSGSKPRAPGSPDVERLWNEYFSDPRQWWDNRAKKASPKSPDFKHKTTNEALWVVSRNTPTWVPLQLEKLEAARQEFISSGGGNGGQNNRLFSGGEFKDF
jgi:single stranded DNA-binding protein